MEGRRTGAFFEAQSPDFFKVNLSVLKVHIGVLKGLTTDPCEESNVVWRCWRWWSGQGLPGDAGENVLERLRHVPGRHHQPTAAPPLVWRLLAELQTETVSQHF